jgi:mRNA interferase RelE/StbE
MTSGRFRLEFTRDAAKDIRNLRSAAEAVLGTLSKLEVDPYAGHSLSGSLKGARSLEFTIPGSGAGRAVYYVLEQRICLIIVVGPHENIYDKATRRAKALKQAGRI